MPNPAELGRTLLGERLDHFELLEYVGGGGMGAVFRALDTRLNREVALKVLALDQAGDEEKVRRFQNEAQSAARLDHDHIARVYFVGQDRGLHYIVFEFIEGVNLRDLVERKGPLPLEEAVSYTLQIAEALAHASSRDVVHRDIKPSNVLITPQGKAKLVDMGLARLHQVEHSAGDLTSSGVTLGTFDYISPEQARDPRSADVRSDIYSLGCTLYFVLTGQPPFPDGNVLQKLLQHNNDPPPDPVEFNPELPEVVSRLVRKMLSKDPRRRHQNPGELITELLGIVDQLGLPLHITDAVPLNPRRPGSFARLERNLPWVASVAALCGVVLLLDRLWSKEIVEPDAIFLANQRPLVPPPTSDQGQPHQTEAPRTVEPAERTAANPRESLTPVDPQIPSGPYAAAPNKGELPGPVVNEAPVATEVNGNPSQRIPGAVPNDPKDSSRNSTGVANVPPLDTTRRPPGISNANPAIATNSSASPNTSPTEASVGEAGPTPIKPDVREPSPMEAARAPGRLIVDPNGDGTQTFQTLRQACARARNGDVIELRYNGRLVERPIRVSNLKFTIRAAEQCQPIVLFQPRELEGDATDPQAMISLTGGQLSVSNVTFELEVPRRLAISWTMFQSQRCESILLDRCVLTILNSPDEASSYQQRVAFFDAKGQPGVEMMAMEQNTAPFMAQPLQIQLRNCIARGEAVLLRSEELQGINLDWQNGLLATSERLLEASGAEMPPRFGGKTEIRLRNVTLAVRAGLCRLASSSVFPHLLPCEIDCRDSVLVTSIDAPLIEQTGIGPVSEFEQQFRWSSSRCYYSGFSTFWQISSQETLQDPHKKSFDQWQDFWNLPRADATTMGQVFFKQLPDGSRPFHSHCVADYQLDDSTARNAARAQQAGEYDAGFRVDSLPPEPESNLGNQPATPRFE